MPANGVAGAAGTPRTGRRRLRGPGGAAPLPRGANGVGSGGGGARFGGGGGSPSSPGARRVGLLVAAVCVTVAAALVFFPPPRGSPIELAVRRAAASASAARGAGAEGSTATGAAAAAGEPPPILPLRRREGLAGLLDEVRRREQVMLGGPKQPPQQQQQQPPQNKALSSQPRPQPHPSSSLSSSSSSSSSASSAAAAAPPPTTPPQPLRHALWWFGPIFSASGYGTEAIDFLLSLARAGMGAAGKRPPASPGADEGGVGGGGPLRASHHGDTARDAIVAALSLDDRADLLRLADAPALPSARLRPAIVVCHTFATNVAGASAEWARWRARVERSAELSGLPAGLPPGEPCPPDPRRFAYDYVIIRTMYETHVPPPGAFIRKVNSANEVWVPSRWGVESFAAGGVERGKLRAVAEGVNTSFFDPARVYRPGQEGSRRRPDGVEMMDLAASGRLVFGRPREERAALGGGGGNGGGGGGGGSGGKPFVFLSSFKWEPRKGWDVLLNAYLTEFLLPLAAASSAGGGGSSAGGGGSSGDPSSAPPNVELHILTRPYAGNGDFAGQMRAWADAQLVPLVPGKPPDQAAAATTAAAAAAATDAAHATHAAADAATAKQTRLPPETPTAGSKVTRSVASVDGPHADNAADAAADADDAKPSSPAKNKQDAADPSAVPLAYRRFPAVYVHTNHIADLASLYSAADAFVLPSRGEGWGRPHVEAMSMALPVLATNWSGPVEFLDETVGYPISIEGLEVAGGTLKWARPSVAHLRRLMRRVVERPGEARALGLKARRRMVERYSPAVIARLLEDEFRRIEDAMP